MKKNNIANFVTKISPKLFYHLAYFHHRHHFANFDKPKNLSEIWIKKILDGCVNNYYTLADKYLVREYVKQKGLESTLTPLVAYYENAEQLTLEKLPQRFALKANFGAGMNLICTDKGSLDESKVKQIVSSWLSAPPYNVFENHYNLIDRKIICEEFIDDGTGGFPIDYKFMCIKGKVYCILVCSGRETGHADYIPYNTDFKPLFDFCIAKHDMSEVVGKPANFDEMLKVAEQLASDIDLVRVDLFSNGKKIWFGEMTLTPDGCIFRRWTQKAIDEMGEYYRSH